MSGLTAVVVFMIITMLLVLGGLGYYVFYLSDDDVQGSIIDSEVPGLNPLQQLEREQEILRQESLMQQGLLPEQHESEDHQLMNGYYYIQYDGHCEPLCDRYLSWISDPLTGEYKINVRPDKTMWRVDAVLDEPNTYYIHEFASCKNKGDLCDAFLGISGVREEHEDDYVYSGGMGFIDQLKGPEDKKGNEIKELRFSKEKVKIFMESDEKFSISLIDIPSHYLGIEPMMVLTDGGEMKQSDQRGWVKFFKDPSTRWKFTFVVPDI